MVEEYRCFKQVEGPQEASIHEAMPTLGHFRRSIKPESSSVITQNALDQFTLDRGREASRTTLNKDIRNLNAVLNRAGKNRFLAAGLEVKKVKVAQKPVVALSPRQVRDLLTGASKYPTLRLRVLLAVTTGEHLALGLPYPMSRSMQLPDCAGIDNVVSTSYSGDDELDQITRRDNESCGWAIPGAKAIQRNLDGLISGDISTVNLCCHDPGDRTPDGG